jgi:hypothetical protein
MSDASADSAPDDVVADVGQRRRQVGAALGLWRRGGRSQRVDPALQRRHGRERTQDVLVIAEDAPESRPGAGERPSPDLPDRAATRPEARGRASRR